MCWFLLALAGGLLALLVRWINGMIKNAGSFTETLVFAYSLFAAAVILISILLPLVYMFGERQARFMLVAIAAIPMTAFYVFRQIPDEQIVKQILLLSPFVLVAFSIISFTVSHGIYRRKEV